MDGNIINYDCDDAYNHDEITQMINVQDLFSRKKMVIIKNYFLHAVAADQKILRDQLVRQSEDNIIFWEHGTPRKNASLFTWLIKNADHIYESLIMAGPQLEKWIDDRVKKNGGMISHDAIVELVAFVGNDLWLISMEIEKLIAYADGDMIDVHHVQKLVHGKIDADMFATIEALCSSRREHALHLLRKQRAKGDEAFHIFSMYAYQMRLLLRVSSVINEMRISDKSAVAKILHIHPFVAQKAIAITRSLSLAQLKKAHRTLTIFDHEIKTGQRDIDTALDLFIVSM